MASLNNREGLGPPIPFDFKPKDLLVSQTQISQDWLLSGDPYRDHVIIPSLLRKQQHLDANVKFTLFIIADQVFLPDKVALRGTDIGADLVTSRLSSY
jgi:hypothetical protein